MKGPRPSCRMGIDIDTWHDCGLPLRAKGYKKVLLGGMPWSRFAHKNTPHLINGKDPCSKIHIGVIAKGSKLVMVGGLPAGRIGDPVLGCGAVATGYLKVHTGG